MWGATQGETFRLYMEEFQSTRPVWGATRLSGGVLHLVEPFQSTRPVWGATAKEVTTSLLCHVFMGIPLHKYDFLGT